MKIVRKILGVSLFTYPVTLLALMTHTTWEPVKGGAAYTLGCLAVLAGFVLVSPLLDD